jgi:hypothetical protein
VCRVPTHPKRLTLLDVLREGERTARMAPREPVAQRQPIMQLVRD